MLLMSGERRKRIFFQGFSLDINLRRSLLTYLQEKIMNVPKNSMIKIGNEDWTIIYRPKVIHNNNYVKALKVISKKEIYLSLQEKNGKPYDRFTIASTLQKAILPLIEKQAIEKYGEKEVKEVIKDFKK